MYLYIQITIERYLQSESDRARIAYYCFSGVHIAYPNREQSESLVTTINLIYLFRVLRPVYFYIILQRSPSLRHWQYLKYFILHI